MSFDLKVQIIKGNKTGHISDEQFSTAVELNITDAGLMEKRGKLFIVLNMNASKNFNIEEAAHIFIDNIKDNYYKIADGTPMMAIEAAINLSFKTLMGLKSKPESDLALSFCTALVWNRVLYTTFVGAPAIYLIRGAGVRDLSQHTSGNKIDKIWTNSSILDNDDVVVIGTEKFAEKFSAQNVVNSLGVMSKDISGDKRDNGLAAILIKVIAKETETQNTVVNKIRNIKVKNSVSNAFWKAKKKLRTGEKLSNKFKSYQSKKTAPVASIGGVISKAQTSIDTASKKGPKRLKHKAKSGKRGVKVLTGVVMLIVITSLNWWLFNKEKSGAPIAKTTYGGKFDGVQPAKVFGVSDGQTPDVSRTVKFSDISEGLIPIELSIMDNSFIVLDANSSALYSVSLQDLKSTRIKGGLNDPKYMDCDADNSSNSHLCYILTDDGILVLDPEEPSKVDVYSVDIKNIVGITSSWNMIYILTQDEIWSLMRTYGSKEPIKWLKDDLLSNTKSITATDNAVYVLSSNDIFKYVGGTKREFEIDKKLLNNPSQIIAFDQYIYVLDDDSRVLVFDRKTGKQIKEVQLVGSGDIEKAEVFSVARDKNTPLIFSKGSVFYIVDKVD